MKLFGNNSAYFILMIDRRYKYGNKIKSWCKYQKDFQKISFFGHPPILTGRDISKMEKQKYQQYEGEKEEL